MSMEIQIIQGMLCRIKGADKAPLMICIHGYGDAGSSFIDLMETGLSDRFRMVAIDLPGFGASPPVPNTYFQNEPSLKAMGEAVAALVQQLSPYDPVGIIAHSMGAPVASYAAHRLGTGRVRGIFSIEGVLLTDNVRLAHISREYADAESFQRAFHERVPLKNHSLNVRTRYHGNAAVADANSFWAIGHEASVTSPNDILAKLYASAPCPKQYYWGEVGTTDVNLEWLRGQGLADLKYEAHGHWPHIDAPFEVALEINDFFQTIANT